jgi:hypothetical protein
MENENVKNTKDKLDSPYVLPLAIILSAAMLSGAWMYNSAHPYNSGNDIASLKGNVVTPSEGVVLPVAWGNLGKKLVDAGAIDVTKFTNLYIQRGEYSDENERLLTGDNNGKLKITEKNAGYLLNLFWALGLAEDNPILSDKTGMANPNYRGSGRPAEGFASTGGWSMAKGDPMEHYSQHKFFGLNPEQQALVDKVSRGIYRPCCANSTHFPDCNHGMAMLGLLELMASQGVSEQDMWKTALAVNSYWFPDTYLTIATYMKTKGVEWKDVNLQEILGINYSSAQGFARISAQVTKPTRGSGLGGCSVETGQTAPSQSQSSGCGV